MSMLALVCWPIVSHTEALDDRVVVHIYFEITIELQRLCPEVFGHSQAKRVAMEIMKKPGNLIMSATQLAF
jgi:hypothetical protein